MRTRALGWLCVTACGGAAVAPIGQGGPVGRTGSDRSTAPREARGRSPGERPVVDPIAALAPPENPARAERAWVTPGPIQLELGGPAITAAGSGQPIEVGPIDHEGNWLRVAVRLEHARFSVWIDRKRMLPVIQRDQRIDPPGGPAIGRGAEVVVRAGAVVQRLAHRDHTTQIRFVGALEVEGWVPDDALGDRGAREHRGAFPSGQPTLMVLPGTVIRSEPTWAGTANQLALVADSYALGNVRDVDARWSEVAYEDGDVRVHGFASRQDPPGRLHRWRETDATPTVTPNATVASGTCLYARVNGEPIGYVVGNRPVDLDVAESGAAGWWSVTIDTPWGPLGFAARGAIKTELAACAPAGAVPPATPLAPLP